MFTKKSQNWFAILLGLLISWLYNFKVESKLALLVLRFISSFRILQLFFIIGSIYSHNKAVFRNANCVSIFFCFVLNFIQKSWIPDKLLVQPVLALIDSNRLDI